jgi:cobyrinic acid a,c-diamide synthase
MERRRENLAFSMQRGTGFINGQDGVCINNVLATYTHIHALGDAGLGQGNRSTGQSV